MNDFSKQLMDELDQWKKAIAIVSSRNGLFATTISPR